MNIAQITLFCSLFVGALSATAGAAEDSATILQYLRELPCPNIYIQNPEQPEENNCPLEMRTSHVDRPEMFTRRLYTIHDGGVQLTVWWAGSPLVRRYFGNADGTLASWNLPKGVPYDVGGEASRVYFASMLKEAAEHIRTIRQ